MSIRIKLILMTLFITTTVPITVGLLAFKQSKKVLTEQLKSSFDTKLESARSRLQGKLSTIMGNASSWSKQAVMNDIRIEDDDLNILSYLVANQKSFSIIRDMTVADLDGQLVASTVPDIGDWDDDQYQQFMSNYQLGEGQAKVDTATGFLNANDESSYLSLPVIDVLAENKDKLGYLLVRLNRKELDSVVASVNANQSEKYLVNIYLSRENETIFEDRSADERFEYSYLKDLEVGTEGFTTIQGELDNLVAESVILSSQETGLGHDLRLSIAQPESVVFKSTRDLARNIGVASLFIVAIALGIGLGVSRSIGKPILQLRATTERIIDSNDLSYRVTVQSRDEVGQLAHSFNTLFDTIEESNHKLEEYNRTLERTVEERTSELSQAKASISEMIDNMRQGVITFDRDMLINEYASVYTGKLLDEEEPVGKNVLDLLFGHNELDEDSLRRTKFALTTLFGCDDFQWSITIGSLPKEIVRMSENQKKYLKIGYEAIYDDKSEISRIMMIIEDITELKKTQAESERRQQELQKISDLISIDKTILSTFIAESLIQIEEGRTQVESLRTVPEDQRMPIIAALFRGMHTIKGSAGLFKLKQIAEVAHTMEDYLGKVQRGEVDFDKSVLDEIAKHLDFVEKEILAYQSMRDELFGGGDQDSLSERISDLTDSMSRIIGKIPSIQDEMASELSSLQGALYRLKGSDFSPYLESYSTLVEDLKNRLGKKIEPLKHELEWRFFDKDLAAKINGFLIHIIRNSLDHGVELPDDRVASNKPESATIQLNMKADEHTLYIEVEDDGRGIDGEKLAQKALEKGQISADQLAKMTMEEKVNLLFLSGLSTADQVTDISGRGVGVDAVYQAVKALGGELKIETEPGRRTMFSIQLPLPRDEDLIGNKDHQAA